MCTPPKQRHLPETTPVNRVLNDVRDENRELVEELRGRVFDLESENEKLRQTIGNLESEVCNLQGSHITRLNDLEQHGRKNSLRIHGLEDISVSENVEECVDKIVKFVSSKLNVDISSGDIDIAHRLGKFNRDRPRNVIVKFTHRRKKIEIIRARSKLKKTRYTIFEDLTKINQQILKDAYRLQCVKHSFSTDGKLFAILHDGRKRRLQVGTPLTDEFLMKDSNFV
ncbi:uncharacterized protein [Argopecten irradians]|uniref:uncharacterized protein n=1 Tax=Argopecten irradians TaxID=31199 RepID=UPI003719BD1F